MSEPISVLVYHETSTFDRTIYPWVKQIVVYAEGGSAGVAPPDERVVRESKYVPARSGQVVLELYDHDDHPHPHTEGATP